MRWREDGRKAGRARGRERWIDGSIMMGEKTGWEDTWVGGKDL